MARKASKRATKSGRRAAEVSHSPGFRNIDGPGLGHGSDDSAMPEGAECGDGAGGRLMPGGYAAGGHAGVLASGLDAKVLVLNKVWVAIRVISARRAFAMLMRELAEVVHVEDGQYLSYDFSSWAEVSELARQLEPDSHDWVKTVRLPLAVPKIIRLHGYDRLPDQRVKLNRRNLFARDGNRCQYCGHHFPTSELSIDHVLPRSQGGGDTWENLVCSCVRCNARKGGRTPEQARMALVRKPIRPRRNPLIQARLGNERYASWKQFLDNAYWSVELK